MKILALYHLKPSYPNATGFYTAISRSGNQTIVDKLIKLNIHIRLKKFRSRSQSPERGAILSSTSWKSSKVLELKLNWSDTKNLGRYALRDKDENLLVKLTHDGLTIIVFCNESSTRVHQYYRLGLFAPEPDFELESQLAGHLANQSSI